MNSSVCLLQVDCGSDGGAVCLKRKEWFGKCSIAKGTPLSG